MAPSPRTILVAAALAGMLLVTPLTKGWISEGVEHDRGNRARWISVVRIECLIALCNVFIYAQMMEFFERDKKIYVDTSARSRASQLLLLIFAGSHACYLMFYFPAWCQALFFEISNILSGVWTNLLGFTAGFCLVNWGVWIMEQWLPTRRFLQWLTRPRILHALAFDRKVQIKATVVIVAVLSAAMWYSSDKIVIRHVTLPVRGLTTPDKAPLRLALLSDLHIGGSVYKEQVARVADEVMQLSVDAVLIVGDMVDGEVASIADRLEPLWHVAAMTKTYFVTGNHDYYYGDVREWLALYKRKGIHVLRNNYTMLKGVCLAGVDDISSGKSGVPTHRMNISLAVSDCPITANRVLLSHNPASVREIGAEELRGIDVILSGHTHAGQFYVVAPVVYWMLPYFYGEYDISDHGHLFVTAGTLYQGPPLKNLAMSQIWVVTLVPE